MNTTTEIELPFEKKQRDPANDADWQDIAELWNPREDTIYLNHGSFGLPLRTVREFRRQMIDRLDAQPMDYYVRHLEQLMADAREATATFVGTESANLVFVENATFGMNVVAESFPLSSGDEVLLNDHEYGAVHRIWERATERAGAKTVTATLPEKFESTEQIVESLISNATAATKLLIISHITSPTAIILPVKEICEAFHERGIAVCIDGPHAPVHVDLNISDIGCDFYTASCHKWLSATLGSGFCFAHPKWHRHMQPTLKSWGRLLPALPKTWDEEFTWPGTRDPSGYLSVPVAIQTMQQIGIEAFRERCYGLAAFARDQLIELTGESPIAPNDWYGCMAHVPLPAGDFSDLQMHLWLNYGIEIPIINFNDRWFVRVSCHLYNRRSHIETLMGGLQRYLDSKN